jgi:hypothetical protein
MQLSEMWGGETGTDRFNGLSTVCKSCDIPLQNGPWFQFPATCDNLSTGACNVALQDFEEQLEKEEGNQQKHFSFSSRSGGHANDGGSLQRTTTALKRCEMVAELVVP